MTSHSSSHLFSHLQGNFVSVDDCIAECSAYADAFRKNDSKWLSSRPRLIFVDGSWYLGKDRSARKEYEEGPRIPGAKFFDIDDVCAKGPIFNPKNLPHMMPPKKIFELTMDALGIENSDRIIVYGVEGCLLSTRAWYTIRAMGHDADRVHLMQGSLVEWEQKGGKLETGPVGSIRTDDFDLSQPSSYQAVDATSMIGMDVVQATVRKAGLADAMILDARSEGRFKALVPEPRPGLRGGHIPFSFNVPATELLDGSKYRSVPELKAVFENAGVPLLTEKSIICSCGSGVTACVIAAALEQCGRDRRVTFIFDGSWIEWASDDANIVVH